MKCPCCKETSLVISEKKGIEIDYCPDCRGIWLDRGELDKIIERNREEVPEERKVNDTNSHYRQDNYHKPHKRRKSFLEDLFD